MVVVRLGAFADLIQEVQHYEDGGSNRSSFNFSTSQFSLDNLSTSNLITNKKLNL